MKKKKSLGQHFLIDEEVAWQIVASLQREEKDMKKEENQIVVEVGPGEGVLTKHLLKRQQTELFLVELDRRLPALLMKKHPQLKEHILEGDVLKMPFDQLFKDDFVVIGNFPYNISSQILFKILAHKDQIPQMVGMFQKEVAERVAAVPGSKIYGVTSVLIQLHYKVEYLFTVPPHSFDPPPKVQSGVIRMHRHYDYQGQVNESNYRKVVKQAFSQRRKKLSNALKGLAFNLDELPTDIFHKRAEELSVPNFIQLTQALIL